MGSRLIHRDYPLPLGIQGYLGTAVPIKLTKAEHESASRLGISLPPLLSDEPDCPSTPGVIRKQEVYGGLKL